MKKGLLVAVMVTLVFHVNHIYAQYDPLLFASGITAEELKEHLMVFASDAFEGRETGKPGQALAASYLEEYYKQLGIPGGVAGFYQQEFSLREESLGASFITMNGNRYEFIQDFFCLATSASGIVPIREIVFVGYGIDDTRYNDYTGHDDLQGKWVVCVAGEPKTSKGLYVLTGTNEPGVWTDEVGRKMAAAEKRGASGILLIRQDYDSFIPRIRFWLEAPQMMLDFPEEMKKNEEPSFPYFFVSPRIGDVLSKAAFGKPLEKIISSWEKKGQAKTSAADYEGEIHVERTIERTKSQNVLAFIEGSDERLKDEVVVISAHYDHVGVIKGEIHNGADDDGSGTVTAMEIAEAFHEAKLKGQGPRRSVLILHVSGEEKGLLGSEWYTEFPAFSLDKTVCNLNIDMIGRTDEEHAGNERYVYLIGSDRLSSDLHRISEEANTTYTGLQLDYTYNDPADPNRYYYRSDHYNFARKGIPVIFYFSGVHEDYHRPGDDPEKIMYGKMAEIGQLIFHTAWKVANADRRPAVDKAVETED